MSLDLIKKYNISAKKSLGQNFLVDERITSEISQTIDIMGSNIIEVGPGYGVLTEKLLEKFPRSLHLVELDTKMIDVIESRIGEGDITLGDTQFQIHNTDVLQFFPSFPKYDVIANIPYYITSPILRHFLYDIEHKPEKMVILMQKDVGDKILGKGKSKSSVLSLFIEKKCRVTSVLDVPKESFYPAPKVESQVLLFEIHNDFGHIDDEKFLEVIKKGFCEPRKKLIKNLVKAGYEKDTIIDFFQKHNLSENIRGEDLNVKMWCQLSLGIVK